MQECGADKIIPLFLYKNKYKKKRIMLSCDTDCTSAIAHRVFHSLIPVAIKKQLFLSCLLLFYMNSAPCRVTRFPNSEYRRTDYSCKRQHHTSSVDSIVFLPFVVYAKTDGFLMCMFFNIQIDKCAVTAFITIIYLILFFA